LSFRAVALLFSFTPPPPSPIHTLSLHDALPILVSVSRTTGTISAFSVATAKPTLIDGCSLKPSSVKEPFTDDGFKLHPSINVGLDRKSTRLNSSHVAISDAVFCLKIKIIAHAEQ